MTVVSTGIRSLASYGPSLRRGYSRAPSGLTLIIDVRHHISDTEGDKEYKSEDSDNEEANGNGSHNASFAKDAVDKELEDAIKFKWTEDIQDLGVGKDWGATARAHCVALDLLREAVLGRTHEHKIRMHVSDQF